MAPVSARPDTRAPTAATVRAPSIDPLIDRHPHSPSCAVLCGKQNCTNAGTCATVAGYQTCVCNATNALDDCSATIGRLPPIQQTFPDTQYSSWDKYDNDHPIYNDSTIAQIRIEMKVSALSLSP